MENEKRLIDANELLRDAEDYGPIKGGLADMYDVKWLVNAQPTVDAVEVVHGHWIDLGRNYYTVVSQCSECSSKYDFRSPYCPNCGAKMDGGKENG